jgi:anti-anti-sigma factor
LELGRDALSHSADLMINLSGVDFIDSSGIGALVNLAKQARDAGGDLSLAAVPTAILKTIFLLRLDKFFRIYPDLNSALAAEPFKITTAETILETAARITPAENTLLENTTEKKVPGQNTWTIVQGPLRFDANTSQQFKETCSGLIGENPYLILDLTATIILTSAGLAVLAYLHKLAAEKNGQLRITNCSSDVLQTIRMVRMDKILEITQEVSATPIPG